MGVAPFEPRRRPDSGGMKITYVAQDPLFWHSCGVQIRAQTGNVYYDPDEQPSGYKQVGTNSQSFKCLCYYAP